MRKVLVSAASLLLSVLPVGAGGNSGTARNSVFMFTVGYRIGL